MESFNKSCYRTENPLKLYKNKTEHYTSYEDEYSDFTDPTIKNLNNISSSKNTPSISKNYEKAKIEKREKDSEKPRLSTNHSAYILE